MARELFKKYHSRLAKEGLLKAMLHGLIVGFSALLIAAAVSWLLDFKGLWLLLVFWGATVIVSTLCFYLYKFRPTTKAMVARIDQLGLEERILTMVELESDTSYIAMRQREDAKRALGGINEKLLKFAVSVPLIVAVAVSGIFGIGMTTAAMVKQDDFSILPSRRFNIEYTVNTVSISITNEDGTKENITVAAGEVRGKTTQRIAEGRDAAAVIAVPIEGYIFVQWSDGNKNPYRHDVNVLKNIKVTSVFEKIDNFDAGGIEEDKGDIGQPSEPNNAYNPDSSPPESDSAQKYLPNNQVIDGKTFYGDNIFRNAYQEMLEKLSKDSNISDELKKIISDYYDTIEK